MQTTKTKKLIIQPLPWTHVTDNKRMSAVVDARGVVVCGSLICDQRHAWEYKPGGKARTAIDTHDFIVNAVNNYEVT